MEAVNAATVRHAATVTAHIERTFRACLNAPAGGLQHPFIDPGEGYRGILWDWDAYFCLVGLKRWAAELGDVAVGCVRNFIAHQRPDGSVPYSLTARSIRDDQPRQTDGAANSAKPLLAQFALLASEYAQDFAFLPEVYGGLVRHCDHWEAAQQTPWGLFTFRSHRGSGTDDHPAVYCRPFNSSVDVYLNSLMVKEYRAMAALAQVLQKPDDVRTWIGKASILADAINEHLWDPIDGCYYNLDASCVLPGHVNQPVHWVTRLKVRSWTMVMPLWAGVAPKDRAERLIREHLCTEDGLRCAFGIRSLSPREPAYEITVGSNPSCWRGPVWIVANYLAWQALQQYDIVDEAATLAADVLAMLAADIEQHGAMHEYYHPDTGQGLTHRGFLNWNTLAACMAT